MLFLMTGATLVIGVAVLLGVAWVAVAIPVVALLEAGHGLMALIRRLACADRERRAGQTHPPPPSRRPAGLVARAPWRSGSHLAQPPRACPPRDPHCTVEVAGWRATIRDVATGREGPNPAGRMAQLTVSGTGLDRRR